MQILDTWRAAPPGSRASRGRWAAGLAGVALLVVVAAMVAAREVTSPRLSLVFEPERASVLGHRAAMAALGLVGLVAVAVVLARTCSRRAAVVGALALATMPVWFVHARAATGAMGAMAAGAVVFGGLGVALFDRRASRYARALGLVAALAATAGAALTSRGIFVAAGPAWIAAGVARVAERDAASRASGAERAGRDAAHGLGGLALGVGVALSLLAAVFVTTSADGALAAALVGAPSAARPAAGSSLASLAYVLLPWGPLVPIALAERPLSAAGRFTFALALLSPCAHALVAPRAPAAVFVGAPAIAAAVAIALDRLGEPGTERRTRSIVAAAVVAAAVLVSRDIESAPERAVLALGAIDASALRTQIAPTAKALRVATLAVGAAAALGLVAPAGWLPVRRATIIAIAGIVAGLALRLHSYGALLERLSPGEAFETWARRRGGSEPLGLLGVPPRVVPTSAIHPLEHPSWAAEWLGRGERPERRFVALGVAELPRMNAAHRALRGRNVSVIAGEGGSVLLAVSALAPGEVSQNPLDSWVREQPPPGLRPLGAVFGERLEVVGWEVTDERGRPIDHVRPGKSDRARFALRVLPGAATADQMGAYCTFIHVDHNPVRFAAEHREHPHPMGLWRAGDVVIDEFVLSLPPHFRAGKYPMYFGVGALPCADDWRMPITAGADDGHGRAAAGLVEVR